VDNIEMDVKEIGKNYVTWIYLLQDSEQRRAVVNTVMERRIPQEAIS
jgi:hypothetical protein